MRVLINAASAKRGGIVTYTQNVVRYLLERNIEVTVAAPSDFPAPDPGCLLPVKAADYGAARRVLWEQIPWRYRVGRRRPDVLFSSANFGLVRSPVPEVLLMREGGLFDRRYLSHVAPAQGALTMVSRHFRRRLMLLSARHADHVITPSAAMRDCVIGWDPALSDRITVNHYGARHDLFAPQDAARGWRRDGRLRLLYVSVYYPHKCPGVVCGALDVLAQAGIDATATITMTMEELTAMPGAAQDRILVGRAAAAGRVTLGHHSYDRLPRLYAEHDIFVFPSVSETFGHPMVEAMVSGIPIVAADTPINREICGEGALYFTPFSRGDLAAKVRTLDADAALRLSLAEAAEARVANRFRWEDHVERLIETFDRAAGRERGAPGVVAKGVPTGSRE